MTISIQPDDEAIFSRLQSNGRITQALRRLITQRWNTCSICGLRLSEGRPAFAGYDATSVPLLVGTCCADEMRELATPVYWSSSLNISARDDQAVWRYMDFAKFVAMLQSSGLYFSRADKFDDRFEGATGIAARQASWDEYYLSFFRKVVVTPPPDHPVPVYTEEQLAAEANRLLQSLKAVALDARRLLISCWHGNDTEAEALWRLYSPPGTAGVAIRSTVGKLWDACASCEHAVVGRVHYVDFKHSFASIQNERIFQKRKSLSHEQEIRIVLHNERQSPAEGKILPCDLGELISEVVISPFAPNWFRDVILDVSSKYHYSFALKQSELLDEPFF